MKYIKGMQGLGDNIYQRAFLSGIEATVYLETPWPQLYADMDHIKPVRYETRLRTQRKNVESLNGYQWHTPPKGILGARVRYGAGSILKGMERFLGVKPAKMTLPDFGPGPVDGEYAVIRPVTVRSEWKAESRNPDPEYIAEACRELRDRGVKTVSVADLEDGHEWMLDNPGADIQLHHGELCVTDLLALIANARCVVGHPGWVVPACAAYDVPAWIVCGGNGGHNAPEMISPPHEHSLSFAVPDRFCRCTDRKHQCAKTVTDHLAKFRGWLDGLHLARA